MGRPITYPDGRTITSSAYTVAPNGGTMGVFLQPIILGMLGLTVDVNSPLVRFTWPIGGAPFQDINDDICYVYMTLRDEPYDKIRERVETTPGGTSSPNNTEIWNYTRCWTIRLVNYGPNAFDNLRAVRGALFDDYFTQQLASGQLFPVSEFPEVMHIPELYNAQWWERADFNFDMYEWVTENVTRPNIASAQVHVITADLGRDLNIYNDDSVVTVNPPAKSTIVPAPPPDGGYYTPAAPPLPAAPTFSPDAGTYGTWQTVTIGTTLPGGTIYYTIDGSTPVPGSSPVYSAPISFGRNLTLRALAYNGTTTTLVKTSVYNFLPTYFTLTPIVTDGFTPNRNPLNPVNWTTLAVAGTQPLQALNAQAIGTVGGGTAYSASTNNATLPANQYVKATLYFILGSQTEPFVFARCQPNGFDNYYLGPTDNGDGVTVDLFGAVDYNSGQNTLAFVNFLNAIMFQGDIVSIVLIGTSISFLVNDILCIPTVTDNKLASGAAGIACFDLVTIHDCAWQSFEAGSAAP